jgi:hypothetical protein
MSTTPTIYAERAWRGFDRITIADDTPDLIGIGWDQSYNRNRCGTSCCYAGHLALEFGARWVVDIDPDMAAYTINGTPITVADWASVNCDPAEYVHAEPDDPQDAITHLRGMPVVHVAHRAANLLGLEGMGQSLFEEDNTRADLERLITDQFGPRPATVGGTDINAEGLNA